MSYRERLRRQLIKGRLKRLAGPTYQALITLELALVRLLDGPTIHREAGDSILAELTAVIKTFERPAPLQRLLASIRRLYPQLNIIVVDDSRQPARLTGVRQINLPFNSGVSAGRQAGLAQVETKYMLNLDDDFIFYRQTDLRTALHLLEEQPKIDLMGGDVLYLPFFNHIDYSQVAVMPTPVPPTHPPGSQIAGLPVYDKVPNFFIARTEKLRQVGWDGHLKVLEHGDFFTRARGILTSVFNARLKCLHAKTPFDRRYMQHKEDMLLDQAILHSRYYRHEDRSEG